MQLKRLEAGTFPAGSLMKNETIKVLLIDENPQHATLVEKYLQSIPAHYELDWVCGREEAFKKIEQERHDVCLVDELLGREGGLHFVEQVLFQACKIPMILQLSDSAPAAGWEALAAGAVDYVVKSQINPALLERSIRYAMKQKQAEARLEEQNQIVRKHVKEAERINRYLIELTQRITEELEQARKIQLALLPQTLPVLPQGRFAIKYEPMEQIGGDFYDIFQFDEHQTGMLLADVSGHGIPAALISFMVSSLFKSIAPRNPDVEKTICQVNNALLGKMPDEKFATIFYCIYNAQSQTLTYSSMGHPPGYLIRPQTQEVLPLKSEGMLLGIFPIEEGQYPAKSLKLLPGDKIFLHTDGLVEVFNSAGQIFGQTQLQKFLQAHRNLTILELIETAHAGALEYSEAADFEDDMTLLGFELLEG